MILMDFLMTIASQQFLVVMVESCVEEYTWGLPFEKGCGCRGNSIYNIRLIPVIRSLVMHFLGYH
jgi:hypothetical protein